MCPFLRVKEERARWSSATGDDGFCSWPPSRITDEKGFGGPFLWRVSSKGPASMHEDASDLPLLLPSSALDSRDPGPLSSTYRFESCTPRRPPIPARPSFALWTRILLCLRFLFFSSSSLGDIIGCMISFWEFFHHAHAAWRYLSDWCMARF